MVERNDKNVSDDEYSKYGLRTVVDLDFLETMLIVLMSGQYFGPNNFRPKQK